MVRPPQSASLSKLTSGFIDRGFAPGVSLIPSGAGLPFEENPVHRNAAAHRGRCGGGVGVVGWGGGVGFGGGGVGGGGGGGGGGCGVVVFGVGGCSGVLR